MKRRALIFTAIAATDILIADQISKFLLIDYITNQTPPFIEVTGFFNLVMVWNYGVSFGLFAGMDAKYGLIALSLIICAALCWWNRAHTRIPQFIATGAIIGGALGNVIDRLLYGAVADFFDVHIAGYHWPAFNVADAAIVLGVIGLFICELCYNTKQHAKQSQ